MNDLPYELLELIATWVPLKTIYTKCPYISKRWNEVVKRRSDKLKTEILKKIKLVQFKRNTQKYYPLIRIDLNSWRLLEQESNEIILRWSVPGGYPTESNWLRNVGW